MVGNTEVTVPDWLRRPGDWRAHKLHAGAWCARRTRDGVTFRPGETPRVNTCQPLMAPGSGYTILGAMEIGVGVYPVSANPLLAQAGGGDFTGSG